MISRFFKIFYSKKSIERKIIDIKIDIYRITPKYCEEKFWQGAATSATVNLANHWLHNLFKKDKYAAEKAYRKGTLEDFIKENKGKTYDEIVSQRGFDKYGMPNGPNLRFVEDPLCKGKYIDMRHMLVVGKLGVVVGAIIEIGQLVNYPGSAMNPQDFYSNALGEVFFDNFPHRKNDVNFIINLRNYLNDHPHYNH